MDKTNHEITNIPEKIVVHGDTRVYNDRNEYMRCYRRRTNDEKYAGKTKNNNRLNKDVNDVETSNQ